MGKYEGMAGIFNSIWQTAIEMGLRLEVSDTEVVHIKGGAFVDDNKPI